MAQQSVDELKSLLKRDLANLDQLEKTLETEHEALSRNDMEHLDQAREQKDELLKAIRERAKRKIHILVNMGYRPDSGRAASAFLREETGDEGLITAWQEAQKKLEACQRRNAVNGRIINHMQRRLTRISDIIRGSNPNQSLYGSGGETRSLNASNVLTTA